METYDVFFNNSMKVLFPALPSLLKHRRQILLLKLGKWFQRETEVY